MTKNDYKYTVTLWQGDDIIHLEHLTWLEKHEITNLLEDKIDRVAVEKEPVDD